MNGEISRDGFVLKMAYLTMNKKDRYGQKVCNCNNDCFYFNFARFSSGTSPALACSSSLAFSTSVTSRLSYTLASAFFSCTYISLFPASTPLPSLVPVFYFLSLLHFALPFTPAPSPSIALAIRVVIVR